MLEICSIAMVHRYTNNGKGGWTHALWPIQDDLGMNQEIGGGRRNYATIADSAVPLILRRLKQHPSLLAWALFDITGVNPVAASDFGNIDRITKAWLEWGTRNKLI